MSRHAIKRRIASLRSVRFFIAFDAVPISPDFIDILDAGLSEDVRVPANEFIDDELRDAVEIEHVTFRAELAMKHDLEKKIAEFLRHF